MRSIPQILAGGQWISGESISAELGVSRAAVWKKIESLRGEGWQIESGGKRGYRLLPGDSIDPVLWENKVESLRYGKGENRFFSSIDSTNTFVKQMALAGAPDGSVCLADCQTAGRGRLGRVWTSPSGRGLWMSVLLRPNLPPDKAPLITLCAAMAMRQAVEETSGIAAKIKWPNDLVYEGKKLCGILLEMSADPDRIEYVVVGTGLNVHSDAYPPQLKERAASVCEFASAPLRRDVVVHYLAALEKLMDRLIQGDIEAILAQYRYFSCTLGARVQVSGAVSLVGVAQDIDADGTLYVRDDSGVLQRILSGDVSVRGVMGYV